MKLLPTILATTLALPSLAQAVEYKDVPVDMLSGYAAIGVQFDLDGAAGDADNDSGPWDAQFGMNFGIEASGEYFLPVLVGATAKFRYGSNITSLISINDVTAEQVNAPIHAELGGYFFLWDDDSETTVDIVLDSSSSTSGNYTYTSTTYLPGITATQRTMIALRGGYYYDQSGKIYNSDNTAANFSFSGLYFGLGYITSTAAAVNITDGSYMGYYDNISIEQYYFDIITGSTTLDVYNPPTPTTATFFFTPSTQPALVDTGWRVGAKQGYDGFALDWQLGQKPGMFDNYYMSVTMSYAWGLGADDAPSFVDDLDIKKPEFMNDLF